MTSFYAQAFADLPVYRPSYTLTKGEEMTLANEIQTAMDKGMEDATKSGELGTTIGMALNVAVTNIVRLRGDLDAKGLLESGEPVV